MSKPHNELTPDRTALDQAYAEAMRELHNRYPEDLDAATLYAEAVMDLRPWNYWTRDKQPYPETREVLCVLDSVLKRNPNHPGARQPFLDRRRALRSRTCIHRQGKFG